MRDRAGHAYAWWQLLRDVARRGSFRYDCLLYC